MPMASDWASAGIPQAAIAFREPGWWGPLAGAETAEWLPGLPSDLVPLAFHRKDQSRRLRLLNPSARRCLWKPGDAWRVRRVEESQLSDAVMLKPGELTELILTQSS